MPVHAIVWWAVAIVLVVFVALAVVQLGAAAAEVKRLKARVDGYAELPLRTAAARAEDDGRRIEAAAGRIDPLVVRAQVALAEIRRGPFRPELVSAFAHFRAGVASLGTIRSR